MPIKFICKKPGCENLTDTRGYCEEHQHLQEEDDQRRKAFLNAKRPNNSMYKTKRWQNLRLKVIQKQPWCSQCGSPDELQVHHIIPPRGDSRLFHDIGNLQVICATCHRVITAWEIRERNRYGGQKK